MPKRKTHNEFVDELSKILPNIEVQDEYINSNTKIYVKCKNCGNSYYALPSNLLKGYNCKQCYLKSKFKTKEEYEQLQKKLEQLTGKSYIQTILTKNLKILQIWVIT